MKPATILMVVNAEWYFWSHRVALARALRARGHDVIVAAAVERGMVARIEADGFRFVPIPLVRGRLAPMAEIRAVIALLRLYRVEYPDLVYHTTIKPILYGSFSAQMLGIVRRVNAIPGLGYVFAPTTFTGRLRRRLAALAYRLALKGRRTRVIFQNSDDRSLFVKQGISNSEQSILISGSGVNLSEFSATTQPASDEKPIVLLASRLLWDKGVGEVVEAARALRTLRVPCRIVIVGIPDLDNPRSVSVKALEEWREEGLIEWWGLRSDMTEVIRQSAIVVLPSYYPEGIPRILLEAAASSRAVITTDTPGCRDAVVDGTTGLLVPPKDVNALVEALKRLLADPALRESMGRAGRKLAEERFDEQFVTAQMVAVCEELLVDG